MSGVSMPVHRPIGRALVVGNASTRGQTVATLQQHGYTCAEADDPYAAIAEICRRPLVYRAVILSLAGLYREELSIIQTIQQRFAHLEVWLAHTDGRQAMMIEAMGLGAAGLIADDGLHRLAIGTAAPPIDHPPAEVDSAPEPFEHNSLTLNAAGLHETVLSADELRALLQDVPSVSQSEAE